MGAVALRKESVDRNRVFRPKLLVIHLVALRKESVDRNMQREIVKLVKAESLSARRAWIEIIRTAREGSDNEGVALRKESVDRNCLIHSKHS